MTQDEIERLFARLSIAADNAGACLGPGAWREGCPHFLDDQRVREVGDGDSGKHGGKVLDRLGDKRPLFLLDMVPCTADHAGKVLAGLR